MTEPELCPECGAFMVGGACPKCSHGAEKAGDSIISGHTGGVEYIPLELTGEERAAATREMSREEVCRIYTKTVKNDTANIQVLFYGFINNYTESDQLNFSITGPSTTGKTFLPREVLRPFPQEDINWKGYTSPKAFYHDRGALVRADGSELQPQHEFVREALKKWMEENPKPTKGQGISEWREQRQRVAAEFKDIWEDIDKKLIVDTHQKFEVFIDQPSDALQRELRPLLSHDRKEIEASITDRTKDGANRTKKVIIRGYPTTVSSSVAHLLDEQEQTRHVQVSPETTQEKFREAIKAQAEALANPGEYRDSVDRDPGFELLRRRIRLIKESPTETVVIRPEDRDEVYRRFKDKHPYLRPRHQRDFPRLIAYIKGHALFNQWTREQTPDGKEIYATRLDLEEGFKILEPLLESNELGIPPHEYEFFNKVLKPALEAAENGLHRNDVSKMYFDHFKSRIGQKARDRVVQLYLETGLVVEEVDPENRRSKRIYSTPPVWEKNTQASEPTVGTGTLPNQGTLDDDPNIQHLRRVAETQLKRAGYMARADFFSFMDAAGHPNQDAVLAIVKLESRVKVEPGGFRWVEEEQP
ncbi:MAG: hypothetical protein ABIJ47_01565 [Candidatus Bathyarchaeota archaeon]